VRPRATDNLIKNTFEKRLRDAQQVNAQFKGAQVTSGASGVLSYDIENDSDWDLTGTLPYVDATTGEGVAAFEITFTGDQSQQWPYCLISIDMRIDGTGTGSQMTFDPSSLMWVYGAYPSDFIQCSRFGLPDETSFNTAYTQSWVITGLYGYAPTYYIKVRGKATCPGTLSIQRSS
jgi:hypothetical protein